MIAPRRAADRGHFDHGWLDTWHSFSFGEYVDREQMGFGPLRVINEDFVGPDSGFPMHPHRDMEILTYDRLCLIASRDGRDGSVTLHQDIGIHAARLSAGKVLEHTLAPDRLAYVQIAKGALSLNGHALSAGDGARVSAESSLKLSATDDCEFLLFEMTAT
ncbi:MAG: pirin family protein [Hydrogenophilales bacterium]|nr:pirin family protein [Hydrogenophilales bacterium]